jgi:uncharacterized protein DUF2804
MTIGTMAEERPGTRELEITTPVELCLPDGRLNRAAVGWSRHPLHRCNLSGRWLRKKRWDFWGVMCDTHLLRMTYVSLDYVGLLTMGLLVYADRESVEHTQVIPFGRGMHFPERPGAADIQYTAGPARLAIHEESGSTRLVMGCRTRAGRRFEADVSVARPRDHETLNVVIPWSDRHFQFTSKQNTRPATGAAVLDGTTYRFDAANNAYGILDYGRGVWPYRTTWNWAAASGRQNGRLIGLNFGGKWTDGTGTTENGLCIDGRLHKIGEDLVWEYDRGNFDRPWHIRAPHSSRVELEFVPSIPESNRLDLGVLSTELHWALGHFGGTVVTDEGDRIGIERLIGWAEEHQARW